MSGYYEINYEYFDAYMYVKTLSVYVQYYENTTRILVFA